MLQSFAAGRWKGDFQFPSAHDPTVRGFGGFGQNTIVSWGMRRNALGVDSVREQFSSPGVFPRQLLANRT